MINMRLKLLSFIFLSLFVFSLQASLAADKCSLDSKVNFILDNYYKQAADSISFVIYQQDEDNNGDPIAGKKVLSGKTDANGFYSGKLRMEESGVRRRHVIQVYDKSSSNGDFWFWSQDIYCGSDFKFEQSLPQLNLIVRDSQGNLLKGVSASLYLKKLDFDGNTILDKNSLVSSLKSSNTGIISLYVAGPDKHLTEKTGTYVLDVSYNRFNFIFDNIKNNLGSDRTYEYILSGLDVNVKNASNTPAALSTINVYEQKDSGHFLGSKVYSGKTDETGRFILDIPAGNYALTMTDQFKKEQTYWDITIGSGEKIIKDLKVSDQGFVENKAVVATKAPIVNIKTIDITDYSGRLVLLNDNNELWYVSLNGERHNISDKNSALSMIKKNLSGIKTSLLDKISLGLGVAYGKDSDGDGLSDELETALGTNASKNDTDNDSFSDFTELKFNYSPFAKGALKLDKNLSSKLAGRFFLQADKNGQLWYINPNDNKRYFLSTGDNTLEILKSLALKVDSQDVSFIPIIK